jgi:hypothetical protein
MAKLRTVFRVVFWVIFVAAAAGCIGWSYYVRLSAEQKMPVEVAAARAEAERIQREVVLFTKRVVPPRLAFAALLQKAGIEPPAAARLTAAAQPVFDLRHVRAGNALTIGRSVLGELREIRYDIDADHILSIAPVRSTDRGSTGGDFHSEIEKIPSQTGTVGVGGQIDGSLFQAVTDAGEKPELAMRLAAIFAYDLDFYTDPRPGDTFRVVM